MLFQLLFGLNRMLTFTVHEQPTPPSDRMDRAEALQFVKDGFSFQAALLGPIWLLAHKLWIGAALYAVAAVALLAANEWLGLPDIATIIGFLGLHLMIGFEADSIERAALEQKGWNTLGSVSGTSALDCERRFFETWLPGQPILHTRHTKPATPPNAQPDATAASANTAMTARPTTARGAQSAAGRLAALWRGK